MTMSGWSQSQNVQFISVLFDFLQIHMAVPKKRRGEMMTDDRLLSLRSPGGCHDSSYTCKQKTSNLHHDSQESSSSSNWNLMSCQPHWVTSGQSNSGHKQIHISKLFSYININLLSSQSTKPITSQTDTNFQRVSPFNIIPVKRAHKARTCWYCRPFSLVYQYQVKEKYKKRNGQTQYKKFKKLYKCIMANTSAIWQQAAHTTYQLSSSCSTRAIPLTKNILEFSGKKSGEWTISRKMTIQKEQQA